MTDRTLRRPMRVYADTSVFGGVFDVKFEEDSLAFFAWVILVPTLCVGMQTWLRTPCTVCIPTQSVGTRWAA